MAGSNNRRCVLHVKVMNVIIMMCSSSLPLESRGFCINEGTLL